MKENFIKTRDGILKIRDFAEKFPKEADEFELFTFTENPWIIEDLLSDLSAAIGKIKDQQTS